MSAPGTVGADSRRRAVPSDFWPRATAALWIAMMVVTLGIGAFGSDALRAKVAGDGPGCPLRTATTVRCAFCGMTHATLALGHGDVGEAFAHHPAAPLVLLFMFLVCGAIVAGRSPALTRGPRPWLLLGVVAAIWAVNWIGAGVT